MLEMPGRKIAVIPFFDPDMVGSLYVPEQAKERSDQGLVKYVGPKCEYIKVGDYVIFPGYDGKNLEIEGEGILIILDEEQVVSTIVGDTIEATEVPGLYFKSKDGKFFPANYEFAMAFIAKALDNADWRKSMKSKEMFVRQHEENKRKKVAR